VLRRCCAHKLALVSLLAEAPHEVLAVGAEHRLLEEPARKLVLVDHVDLRRNRNRANQDDEVRGGHIVVVW
jgi:hypothetical protein